MKRSLVDAADMKVLAYQLGRTPRGVEAIAVRCEKGFPQVVLNFPIVSSAVPFPTLYWLCCPFLDKKVGALEGQGYIKTFQRELAEDNKLHEEFVQAQIAYRDSRKEMLSAFSGRVPEYAKETLEETGIAGVWTFSKVKCLHAHLAHYLATDQNPIGARVAKLIGGIVCNRDCEAQ